MSLRRLYAFVYDYNFPSLVASLFSRRYPVESTYYFLHAAINLCPPSVANPTHTLASNVVVVFHSPVMPDARTLLYSQSIYSFSFSPRPLRTAPPSFLNTIPFGSHPLLIRISVSAHKKSLLARKVVSVLSRMYSYLEATIVRSHPMIWSLALCPDDAEQGQVVYGAEFGEVMFLAKGVRILHPYSGASIASAFTTKTRGRAPLSARRKSPLGTT